MEDIWGPIPCCRVCSEPTGRGAEAWARLEYTEVDVKWGWLSGVDRTDDKSAGPRFADYLHWANAHKVRKTRLDVERLLWGCRLHCTGNKKWLKTHTTDQWRTDSLNCVESRVSSSDRCRSYRCETELSLHPKMSPFELQPELSTATCRGKTVRREPWPLAVTLTGCFNELSSVTQHPLTFHWRKKRYQLIILLIRVMVLGFHLPN